MSRPGRPGLRLLGLGLGLLLLAGCGPLFDPDTIQDRAVAPTERLSAGHSVGQTFVARRPRLTAVDVLLAVYPSGEGDDSGELIFHLRPSPDSSVDLASAAVPISGLAHNSYYRLAFPPQPDSDGQAYYLLTEATTHSPARATLWSSGVDAYPDGTGYRDGQPSSGDLAFRTYYDYDPLWLASDLVRALATRGWLLGLALAALLLPGLALQRWLARKADLDAAERVGLWLGLGLAAAPVTLLLATQFGARLSGPAVVGLLALAALAAYLTPPRPPSLAGKGGGPSRLWRRDWCSAPPSPLGEVARMGQKGGRGVRSLLSPAAGAFATAAGALVLRFVHARDLALPMWGDSVHHALIARLIAETGRVPEGYGPLVPVQPFAYHFGFHVQVAFLHWLSDILGVAGPAAASGIDLARGVLVVGQLLSGLLVFPTYLLASRLAGDRRAGLVAGLVVGLVSLLPAYSVTWGRYPQLAGLAILPAAAYLAERWLDEAGAARLAAATLVGAGLVLSHPRVALLFGAYLLASLATRDRPSGHLRAIARAALLALTTGIVLAPWLARLADSRAAAAMVQPGDVPGFVFPIGLLTTGLDRYLLAAAIAAVGLSLRLRPRAGLTVALWVGLGLLAANVRTLGLPLSLMLTNDSFAISLFLPIAVLDGLFVVSLARLARFDAWPSWLRLVPAALLAALGVLGGQALAGVVNPVCLLATSADVDAIAWVAAHTPADSAFLINSSPWQLGVYQGTDGGYWLPALAGRRASVPPQVYAQGAPADVERIRRLAEATQAEPPDPAALLPLLRAAGLTHVFVGSQGGVLSAPLLAHVPGYRLVYTNGRAAVFVLYPP